MSRIPSRFRWHTRSWGLICALIFFSASSASAQYGYGGLGGFGYGGYGFGFGAVGGVGGYNVGGYGGSYGGYPLYGAINGYNLGYGNTLGLGLVPPAFVGTGTAGIGPVGIGGTNPLFGLGLSPLAIQNAVAEQSLRQQIQTRNPNYPRGYTGNTVRMNLYPPNTPMTSVIRTAPTPATAPVPANPR